MIVSYWILLLSTTIMAVHGEKLDLFVVIDSSSLYLLTEHPVRPSGTLDEMVYQLMLQLPLGIDKLRVAVYIGNRATDGLHHKSYLKDGITADAVKENVAWYTSSDLGPGSQLTDPVNLALDSAKDDPDKSTKGEFDKVIYIGQGNPPRTPDDEPIFDIGWMYQKPNQNEWMVDMVIFLVNGYGFPTGVCYKNIPQSEGTCLPLMSPKEMADAMIDDVKAVLYGETSKGTRPPKTNRTTVSGRTKQPTTTKPSGPGGPPHGKEPTPKDDQKGPADVFPTWLIIVIVVLIVLAVLIVSGLIGYFAIVQPRQSRRRHLRAMYNKDQKRSKMSKSQAASVSDSYTTTDTYATYTGVSGTSTTMGRNTRTSKTQGTQMSKGPKKTEKSKSTVGKRR